jgi:hypothetical protein
MRFLGRTIETAGDVDEWRAAVRAERTRQIIASGKTEIPRSALAVGPRWIEDERDGSFYRVYPNGDPAYSEHCPAFYIGEAGDAVLLERADPASRAELAERRAARDARRAARDAAAKALNEERRRARR